MSETATLPRRSAADRGPLLSATGVTKTFRVARNSSGNTRLTALDGVDLRLGRGETLGLVGESGCGKSTLARVLLLLERPDSGEIRFDGVDPFALKGRELLAWRRRVQMVFQDPYASLNARMTAADIIAEPWRTHRDVMPTASARAARVRELLDLVGLREGDAERYPQEFSGGQRQRIGIARALALDPEIIVCDEPVSALDLSVQAQVLNLLTDLQQQLGVSYVFISHDLSVVRHVADRVSVMYLGKVIEQGPTEDVFDRPLHPYTAALMSAAPTLDRSPAAQGRKRILLEGEVPSPLNPPSGCRFRTRCPYAAARCAEVEPAPVVAGSVSGSVDSPTTPVADDVEQPTATSAAAAGLGSAAVNPRHVEHLGLCHFPLDASGAPIHS
ncbi:ABC transporter ATP-binding protein [Actinoalloteichus sp. GBA129-24]|uniref:ABC transporter ATP-binding protein n=1 Tax=Actinoalloteichus sp. GBA129-24 TaxID=1612551 RepID=UPI000950A618|nr:oligopeptide/dipeptide ABC transporter, ATP-binding protein [Actinoalloteichus sp. GBA129-24]